MEEARETSWIFNPYVVIIVNVHDSCPDQKRVVCRQSRPARINFNENWTQITYIFHDATAFKMAAKGDKLLRHQSVERQHWRIYASPSGDLISDAYMRRCIRSPLVQVMAPLDSRNQDYWNLTQNIMVFAHENALECFLKNGPHFVQAFNVLNKDSI